MCCSLSHVQLFVTPWTAAHQIHCPWNSPGKNTGVGCCSLLQGILPTQGLNPDLLHWRQILYGLSDQGSMFVCVCVKESILFRKKTSNSCTDQED